MQRRLLVLLTTVGCLGAWALAAALLEIRNRPPDIYAAGLGLLFVASGRIAIKVPGRPATVSVSEVFLFAAVLLFGPATATVIVAVDGIWVSIRQTEPRFYRAIFNVAEPAASTWLASHVFFAIAGLAPGAAPHPGSLMLVVATIAMAAVFFALNSTLTAAAIGWENNLSARDVWARHAMYLAVNYYAAASLAALGVANAGFNLSIVGLLAPLLLVSYIAYREASTRVDSAHRHVGEMTRLYQSTVEMLALAVEGKDEGTHGHVRRVQRHARAVAQALGVSDETQLKAIEAGALLHDIGKLGVQDYILNKPGALTASEFDAMKRHATMGARILTAVDFPYPVVPIVRHHHERWDGQGYPDGLVRTEIPLGARILSVIDCYDALTSDRPYRPKMTSDQAAEILRARAGTFYDPDVVEKFIQLIPVLAKAEQPAHDRVAEIGCVVATLSRSAAPATGRIDEPAGARIGRATASLIDTRLRALPGAEACLFMLDSSRQHLAVAHATPRLLPTLRGFEVSVGHGLSGWVVANRSTIRNADPVLDFNELGRQLALRWCTSTPVFAGGELVGALSVYLSAPGGFSEKEGRLVGSLAQHVGLSLVEDAPAKRLTLAVGSSVAS
jgi:putative nucleotidyltransferase with HDIG domain